MHFTLLFIQYSNIWDKSIFNTNIYWCFMREIILIKHTEGKHLELFYRVVMETKESGDKACFLSAVAIFTGFMIDFIPNTIKIWWLTRPYGRSVIVQLPLHVLKSEFWSYGRGSTSTKWMMYEANKTAQLFRREAWCSTTRWRPHHSQVHIA